MRKTVRRLTALVLALFLAAAQLPAAAAARREDLTCRKGEAGRYESVILFTQDMHERFLPTDDGAGGSYGGFARLSGTLQKAREQYPDALTLDGGDFSMGSLFQALYTTQAPELRLMGQMGYDVVTLGNHEFDYRPAGISAMLNAAVDSGDPLPALVNANYLPRQPGEEGYSQADQLVREAFDRYGVEDYVALSRGGITYAVFGIFGEEADSQAPESGMVLSDPVETAQATVDRIQAEVQTDEPLFIICLSHAGMSGGEEAEDLRLAREVEGIDLILSGHSHLVLDQPVQEGNTLIVSGGCYTQYLGQIVVHWNENGEKTGYDYTLRYLGDQIAADPAVNREIARYQALVEEEYLAQFGYTGYDQVLTENTVPFDSLEELSREHRESGLGNLIADAYRYAAAEAGAPADFALTAAGVIRDTIPTGAVTVSDVFNVASLGVGADGLTGYPLVSCYLTGTDLKAVFEVDATITSLMPAAQLYTSGMTFTWNPYRMLFNRVSDCGQVGEDGTVVPIEEDKLYRVVTGLYCGQMLGAVEAESFGLLSITPRDETGTPIDMDRLEDYILHDPSGAEVKEWDAIASYLQSFGGEVPEEYGQSDGRKVEDRSLTPAALLKGCNRITFGILCLALALALLITALIRRLVRRLRRSRRPDLRQRGGGAPYTGGARPKGGRTPLGIQPLGEPSRRFRLKKKRYGPTRRFGEALPGYTGGKRRGGERQPLAFSGIPRYRKGRGGRFGSSRTGQTFGPAYRGKGRK